jgi:hypothetical protein
MLLSQVEQLFEDHVRVCGCWPNVLLERKRARSSVRRTAIRGFRMKVVPECC